MSHQLLVIGYGPSIASFIFEQKRSRVIYSSSAPLCFQRNIDGIIVIVSCPWRQLCIFGEGADISTKHIILEPLGAQYGGGEGLRAIDILIPSVAPFLDLCTDYIEACTLTSIYAIYIDLLLVET